MEWNDYSHKAQRSEMGNNFKGDGCTVEDTSTPNHYLLRGKGFLFT